MSPKQRKKVIESQPFEATTFEPVVVESQDDRALSLAANHAGGVKNYSFKVDGKTVKVKVWEST